MRNYTIDDYINFIFNEHPLPTSISSKTLVDILALIELEFYKINGERMFVFFYCNSSVNPGYMSEQLRSRVEMIHNNNSIMFYHRIPILYKPCFVTEEEKLIIKEIVNKHHNLSSKLWEQHCKEAFQPLL